MPPYNKSNYDPLVTYAFESVTVADSSIGLTAAMIGGNGTGPPAKLALLSVEAAQVRYRGDGTAPTSSVGELLDIGDGLEVWGSQDIAALRLIRVTATSATVRAHYLR